MSKIFHGLRFLLGFVSVAILLAVAIYSASGRLLLSSAPEYRTDIENIFSELIGMPVSIQHLSGRWSGFDPILELSELSVGESQSIFLGEANVRLSFLRSLLALEPRFHSIELHRPYVSLKQSPEGEWSVKGIEWVESSNESGDTDFRQFTRYLDNARINVHSGAVHINARDNSDSNWVLPLISINYNLDHIYASGEILQPGGDKPLFNFALEGHGVLTRETLMGKLYVEARSLDMFNQYINAYEWQGLSVKDVEATGRAWVDFADHQLKRVQADIQVKNIYWQSGGIDQVPLTDLATSLEWGKVDNHHLVGLHGLGFSWAGKRWNTSDIQIERKPNEVAIQTNQIDLGLVSDFAVATGLLPDGLHRRLETTTPDGELQNMHVVVADEVTEQSTKNGAQDDQINNEVNPFLLARTASSKFKLQANLSNVSTGALGGSPGGSGIDGYLEAGDEDGLVLLKSRRFSMEFPNLFLDSWKFSEAEGAIGWQVRENETRILSDGIRLRFPDSSFVYGDFLATVNPPHREDILDLRIALQDVEFDDVTNFVPFYAVGEGLHSWLDASLISGYASEGLFVGFGSTELRPKPNSFTSSVSVHTQNGTLKYDKNWPEIEKLDAIIDVQEAQLSIETDFAEIRGLELKNLRASLAARQEDDIASPPVIVTASMSPNEDQLNYWFKESPLKEATRDIAEQLIIDGDLNFDLELSVGLDADASVGYLVSAHLDNNRIRHTSLDLPFEDLSGRLDVSSSWGVTAENIQAMVFGETASINIKTDPYKRLDGFRSRDTFQQEPKSAAPRYTNISISSQAPLSKILDHFELEKVPGISGNLSHTTSLIFPYDNPTEQELFPRIVLETESVGLNQSWPEPFTKSDEERQFVDATLTIKPEEMNLVMTARKENAPLLSGNFNFREGQLINGMFSLGTDTPDGLPEKGLDILGSLESADIEPWIAFFDGQNFGQSEGQGVINQVLLDVNELLGFDQNFGSVSLNFKPESDRWGVAVQGEKVKGAIQFPSGDELTSLSFDHLFLSVEESLENESNTAGFNPNQLPALDFAASKLVVNDTNYGSWNFDLDPNEEGVVVRNIEGKVASSELTGQLTWKVSEDQNHTTITTAKIKGKDIGKVVSLFDGPKILESETYSGDFALVWPDTPFDFSDDRLSGNLNFSLEKGLFKKGEQADALKIFGVFNAEAITRRLSLDFSDLYKSGVAFDEIKVTAKMDQGLLTLSKPLNLKGPSSNYKITGRTNLASQILDMEMEVSFPVAQNVPLAALMLGAPQVGGAVWLIDKALGEPLSSITNAKYAITGTWEKPNVQVEDVFNASKINKTLQGK